MQFFQTVEGVCRRKGETLEVLETNGASLYETIVSGYFASLATAPVRTTIQLSDAVFRSPVEPARLFQVGLNYHSHLDEIGIDAPASPPFSETEIGDALGQPGSTILLPRAAPDQVDHECEIAIVIGSQARDVAARNAWDVIAGVTACNDVSARDLQRAGLAKGFMAAGKLLRGFKPFGSGLIAGDEARNVLPLSLAVNGEVRQDSTSDDMVFSIPQIVELISANHQLAPGDVIITGSPAGVGIFSGRFLVAGDVVEIFLGELPPLRNTFEKE
jgi:2-keto-4-pentenoate hydratase/2-oxohepta-3-ene-1,7-dioic acid hydratase in catechol pathway